MTKSKEEKKKKILQTNGQQHILTIVNNSVNYGQMF